MSTDLNFYMQGIPGGINPNPPKTRLCHSAWRRFGPQDDLDAVQFSLPIDQSVVPTAGTMQYLPKGRIFSMTPQGTLIPGLVDNDECPVATILIGSNSDSGDVIGVHYGDPANHPEGASAFKDWYNAPVQSLAAGYVFSSTEFDPDQITQFVPGALVTSTLGNINNFDNAGIIRIGRIYVDHIIGQVVDVIRPLEMNQFKSEVIIQGLVIPRFPRRLLTPANLRE